MRRLVACLLTLAPALALADNWRDSLIDAAEEMDDALGAARRGGPQCRNAMKLLIDQAIDEIDAIGDRGGRRISDAQNRVNGLIASAQRSNCPERVARKLTRAADALEDARNDRRRGRDRDDRDDDRRYGNNALPPGVAQRVSTQVELAQLQLYPNVIHDTENKVQVNVPEVRFHNQRGLKFRLGARVRAQNGQFGEWQVDNFYQVPQDEYSWPNATTFYIRHSTLRGIDTANGQFVVRVSVLGENNEELGGVDQPLNVNFRGPMVAAPPSPATPPPGQGQPGQPSASHVRPIPTLMQRDCGTGNDPGCGVNRNGVLAMDKAGFDGLIRSMQANPSDIGREQILFTVLVNNGLTAAQFGIVLDQFRSEQSKINATRKAAPRLTNPQAALGHSAKFRSSLNQQEYVRIISAEK